MWWLFISVGLHEAIARTSAGAATIYSSTVPHLGGVMDIGRITYCY